jgi:hypothetical protein
MNSVPASIVEASEIPSFDPTATASATGRTANINVASVTKIAGSIWIFVIFTIGLGGAILL